MNLLFSLIDFISNIFYRLLYISIGTTLAGIIIYVALRVLEKKISPNWKYIIWGVLIVSMLIPLRIESSLSIYSKIPYQSTGEFTSSELIGNEVLNNTDTDVGKGADTNDTDTNGTNNIIKAPEENKYDTSEGNNIEPEHNENISITPSETAEVRTLGLKEIIPVIWIVGLLLGIIYSVFISIRFNKKIKQSTKMQDLVNIYNLTEKVKSELKMTRNIKIIVQSYVKTPIIHGILKPKLILTDFVNDLSTKSIENIIRHELVHYKMGDIIFNNILIILQHVYWFNPIYIFLFNAIRKDIELRADHYIIKNSNNDEIKSYSMALIEVLGKNNNISMPGQLPFVDNEKNIERRIKMINLNKIFKDKKVIISIISVLIITIISVVFLTSAVANAKDSPAPEDTDPAVFTPTFSETQSAIKNTPIPSENSTPIPSDTNTQNTPAVSSAPVTTTENVQQTPNISPAPIKTPVKEVLSIVFIDVLGNEFTGEEGVAFWTSYMNAYLYINGKPSDKKVKWSSSNERNIVINNEGCLEATELSRSAVITAVLEDGRSVSREVGRMGGLVLPEDGNPIINVSMVQNGNILNGNSLNRKDIISGKSQLYVTINYRDIYSGLIWTSNNPGVVSVNQNGQIEVLKSGSQATITFNISNELYDNLIETGCLREGIDPASLLEGRDMSDPVKMIPIVSIDKVTYSITIKT